MYYWQITNMVQGGSNMTGTDAACLHTNQSRSYLNHLVHVWWYCGTFSCSMRDVLNNTYLDRWKGRGGPTAWPPRLPDLISLGFYLWEHLTSPVYAAPVDNQEALHHLIVDVCQTIRNYPGIFERMRPSMMRCVEACIESRGGHFEHISVLFQL
jgi:hypothetical protein